MTDTNTTPETTVPEAPAETFPATPVFDSEQNWDTLNEPGPATPIFDSSQNWDTVEFNSDPAPATPVFSSEQNWDTVEEALPLNEPNPRDTPNVAAPVESTPIVVAEVAPVAPDPVPVDDAPIMSIEVLASIAVSALSIAWRRFVR